MEEFKIRIFKDSNPDIEFPSFRTLNDAECTELRTALARRYGIDHSDGLSLLTTLVGVMRDLPEFDANEVDFDLSKVFSRLGIDAEKNLYLNWYRFDRIDEMASRDVCSYFSDIFYPGPDDLTLCDDSLDWLIDISHEGRVGVIVRQ